MANEYTKLSKPDLVQICEERTIDASGTRADILQRLWEADKATPTTYLRDQSIPHITDNCSLNGAEERLINTPYSLSIGSIVKRIISICIWWAIVLAAVYLISYLGFWTAPSLFSLGWKSYLFCIAATVLIVILDERGALWYVTGELLQTMAILAIIWLVLGLLVWIGANLRQWDAAMIHFLVTVKSVVFAILAAFVLVEHTYQYIQTMRRSSINGALASNALLSFSPFDPAALRPRRYGNHTTQQNPMPQPPSPILERLRPRPQPLNTLGQAPSPQTSLGSSIPNLVSALSPLGLLVNLGNNQIITVGDPQQYATQQFLEEQFASERERGDQLERDCIALAESVATTKKQLEALQLQDVRKELSRLEAQLQKERERYEESDRERQKLREELAHANTQIEQTRYMIQEYRLLRLAEAVSDLHRSAVVFVRVRPVSNSDEQHANTLDYGPSGSIRIYDEAIATSSSREFRFTGVFSPHSTNLEVSQALERQVHTAMEGRQVVIFADGQSGSGKTTTLFGDPDGVIVQAAHQMLSFLDCVRQRKLSGGFNQIQWGMLEFFGNKVSDLLAKDQSQGNTRTLYMDAKGLPHFKSQDFLDLDDWITFRQRLRKAKKNRKTEESTENKTSSRGDVVVTFRISQRSEDPRPGGETSLTFMHIVDFAGNELPESSAESAPNATTEAQRNKRAAEMCDINLRREVFQRLSHRWNNPDEKFHECKLLRFVRGKPISDYSVCFIYTVTALDKDRSRTLATLKRAEKLIEEWKPLAKKPRCPLIPDTDGQSGV